MVKKHCTAIVLAAGQGKRMGTKVHKQYLLLQDKPVLYYSLQTFQDSPLIDEIYLVTGQGEESYCEEQIVKPYGFTKVTHIVEGGAERYNSVWNALKHVEDGYVFIHDGARMFVDEQILTRGYENVEKFGPYIMIADEIAMPHARPEQGTIDTQISITLFREGVLFDGKETAARLFVTLAAKDNDSHMDALVKISELLSDDDKVEKILAASDVQTLYHYFECV